MQLETYISDLLYRYECVTLPNFGAFLTQNTSATIDETSNTFYAPKKMVSFNEQIQKNDGLLAHYIADVEKIPFETANKKISKRVKLLKSNLTQGETVIFKNIGTIMINKEGKILFEPTYHLNYLTDSFGLSQFVSPSINRETYKEQVQAIEKAIPITVTPERRKTLPYLKYAAVALVALTLGGSVASNYYVNQIEQHNKLAQEEAIKQLDAKIQQATFSLNPLPAITLNVEKQSGSYHIIAGAFRVEENSKTKVQQLKELGFNARILGLNKFGLYEVVYDSYETSVDALKAVQSIRANYNKDAWIKINPETTKVSQTKNKRTISDQENLLEGLENQMYGSDSLYNDSAPNNNHENANIIQIVRDVDTMENGYYIILETFNDSFKKDSFMEELSAKGITNADFFYDGKSVKYFVYTEKFNTLETAQISLKIKPFYRLNGKTRIVKVEN